MFAANDARTMRRAQHRPARDFRYLPPVPAISKWARLLIMARVKGVQAIVFSAFRVFRMFRVFRVCMSLRWVVAVDERMNGLAKRLASSPPQHVAGSAIHQGNMAVVIYRNDALIQAIQHRIGERQVCAQVRIGALAVVTLLGLGVGFIFSHTRPQPLQLRDQVLLRPAQIIARDFVGSTALIGAYGYGSGGRRFVWLR